MKLTFKEYKIIKTKNYLKANNLVFFCNGVNLNCSDWIILEQHLKKINVTYYKIFNKTSIKKLKNSVYKNITSTINGVTLLLKLLISKELKKQIILSNIKQLFFDLLALNLNNKIYSINQVKNIISCNYRDNSLLLFQFKLTNLKLLIKNNSNK